MSVLSVFIVSIGIFTTLSKFPNLIWEDCLDSYHELTRVLNTLNIGIVPRIHGIYFTELNSDPPISMTYNNNHRDIRVQNAL